MKIYKGPFLAYNNRRLVESYDIQITQAVDDVQHITKGFGKSTSYYALVGKEMNPLYLGPRFAKERNIYNCNRSRCLYFKSKQDFINFYKKAAKIKIASLVNAYNNKKPFFSQETTTRLQLECNSNIIIIHNTYKELIAKLKEIE